MARPPCMFDRHVDGAVTVTAIDVVSVCNDTGADSTPGDDDIPFIVSVEFASEVTGNTVTELTLSPILAV